MSDTEFYQMYDLVTKQDYTTYEPTSAVYKNAELIKNYYRVKSFGKSQEEIAIFHSSVSLSSQISLNTFLDQDTLEVSMGPGVFYSRETLATDYSTRNIDMYEKLQLTDASDNIGQNIIYRIAKEIHGYTGKNTLDALVSFYATYDAEDAL
jgi:hypothetical protein